MKAIINGKIFINDEFIENKVLIFNNKIVDIIDINNFKKNRFNDIEIIDANNNYVTPGFIDQHIHGYKGFDTMDKNKNSLLEIKKSIVENGVTSFLPTTVTAKKEDLYYVLNNAKEFMDFDNNIGARVLGVHLEGPYINKNKKGAQNSNYITSPDFDFINEFKDVLKIITVAPEFSNTLDLIKKFKDNINFQMGHTNATYYEALNSIKIGIKGSTHTFNAMTPIHHRDMGAVGATLMTDCYAELICDNIHIEPSLYNFLIKNKGLRKILLITDCMSAGGLLDGEYQLGGLKVILKDKACRLSDGTLAGSSLKLNDGLKNFYSNSNYELKDCIKTVTSNQADYLGLSDKIGSIKKGLYSDIIIIDKNCNVKKTFVNGVLEYEI